MQLKAFRIENWRSISSLEAKDLGPLVVLIGKNSSGKSNILEGLAATFRFFDVAGGATSGIDEYTFYRRRVKKPARFDLLLELKDEELGAVFPAEWVSHYRNAVNNGPGAGTHRVNEIRVMRELASAPQGTWKTPGISWGDLTLVKDGAQSSPEALETALQQIEGQTKRDAAAGEHEQASPDKASSKATPPPGVAVSNSVSSSVSVATSRFSAQGLTTALANLSKLLKDRFHVVSIAREVKTTGPLRDNIVDATAQQQVWTLDQSAKAEDYETFSRVEHAFLSITGERLDLAQGKAFVRTDVDRIPMTSEGGGIQSCFNLTATAFSNPEQLGIFALEEPESHSHPELQRRLFSTVRELSTEVQVFIATHSAIFVDRSLPGSLFVVKRGADGTHMERTEGVVEVLREIGARPSDLFFANRVLFVEGPSDKIAIEAIARGAKVDLAGVQVIAAEGKGGARTRLAGLLAFAKDMVTPFVLLDHDGRGEGTKLLSEGLVLREHLHVLAKGSIEEYYPPSAVERSVKQIDRDADLGIEGSDAWKKWKAGQLALGALDIGKKAVALGGGWKIVLARAISTELSNDASEVPEELIRFLRVVAG